MSVQLSAEKNYYNDIHTSRKFNREIIPEPHFGYFFLKRSMDIICSLAAIIILSPFFIAFAAIISITSPGKCIYKQTRVGRNGRYFTMYKFRSMYINANEMLAELQNLNEMDGPVFKIKNDPRITPVGRFIRKYSIDELPQLFNIFFGDMSIVGPRPALPKEVAEYTLKDSERLLVKPGLTCIWQVSGRNNIDFKEWMELDREYIRKRNIFFDIYLILKTFPTVIKGDGAY